jgi:hypothetical protein
MLGIRVLNANKKLLHRGGGAIWKCVDQIAHFCQEFKIFYYALEKIQIFIRIETQFA